VGEASKPDSRDCSIITVLVEKTCRNFQKLLAVVRIRGEGKPGLGDAFEAAKRLERQPREDLHY
jgi:hypothetical protein